MEMRETTRYTAVKETTKLMAAQKMTNATEGRALTPLQTASPQRDRWQKKMTS